MDNGSTSAVRNSERCWLRSRCLLVVVSRPIASSISSGTSILRPALAEPSSPTLRPCVAHWVPARRWNRPRTGTHSTSIETTVDLLAFEDQAAALLADRELEPDDKADQLADLLSTWETPLDGLRGVPRLAELTAPFEELRLQAVEGLAASQIAGTRSGDAVKMLEALVREYPTRENLWLELARGLHRLGRRDAALSAIQRAREALREHLGVHPSALLIALETELLTDDGVEPAPVPLEPAGGPGGLSSTGNMPRQTTSFVGRDAEVRTLSQLIREHQLVTLTGVGGVGKTRLAVQVATELEHEFDDGAWLVELAPVGNPASVPNAAATALGVRAQPGKSMTASIAETLAGRRMLVVLDNCEHVLDAAADWWRRYWRRPRPSRSLPPHVKGWVSAASTCGRCRPSISATARRRLRLICSWIEPGQS